MKDLSLRLATRWLLPLFLLLTSPALVPSHALAADAKELKAREAFAAGRYEEAIDLFAKLYAESLHPTYLRNIGRAYQNLGVPDKAISSFRDYLRKAQGLNAPERAEVEGYIKEMEALQASQAANAAHKPEPVTAPIDRAVPTEPKSAPDDTASAPLVSAKPASSDEGGHLLESGWFWGAVVVATAAVVVGLVVGGAFDSTKEPSCPAGTMCL